MGIETTPKCPECGTKHAPARGNCESIEKRRGPDVTSLDHPSNNRTWERTLEALARFGR